LAKNARGKINTGTRLHST